MSFMLQILLICTLSVTLEAFGKPNRNPLLVFIQHKRKNDVGECREDYNNIIDFSNEKQSFKQVVKYIMTNFSSKKKMLKQNLRTCGNNKNKKSEEEEHGRHIGSDVEYDDLKNNLICKPVKNKSKKRKILPFWVNPKTLMKNDECDAE